MRQVIVSGRIDPIDGELFEEAFRHEAGLGSRLLSMPLRVLLARYVETPDSTLRAPEQAASRVTALTRARSLGGVGIVPSWQRLFTKRGDGLSFGIVGDANASLLTVRAKCDESVATIQGRGGEAALQPDHPHKLLIPMLAYVDQLPELSDDATRASEIDGTISRIDELVRAIKRQRGVHQNDIRIEPDPRSVYVHVRQLPPASPKQSSRRSEHNGSNARRAG